MKLVYKGKTKDVYDLENGNYLMRLKDDATVNADGDIDPGGNTVGASIEGLGAADLKLTKYLFEKINAAGFPTHFVSADLDKTEMTVRPAVIFGNGLEFICRFRAVGSFMRRYGAYAKEGQILNALTEITLKDDKRGDPPITKESLCALGILTAEEFDTLTKLTKDISKLIKTELEQKGLELYDLKLEFGKVDGAITLIDEIAGGSMRAFKDGKGVSPIELAGVVVG